MTQRIFVAVLTVAVFLSGYGARVMLEPRAAVPPAPTALAQEYPRAATTTDPKRRDTDRAKLVAEIEKIRPQIEAYRSQVDEIYAEFDREFAKILNPAQRAKFDANQKKWAEHSAKRQAERQADRTPMTEHDIMRAREQPMTDVYRMVTVTPRLEWLTKEFDLDQAQQTSTRALLSLRRNKFIALLDATPHPSIRLSRLSPLLERVKAPAAAK